MLGLGTWKSAPGDAYLAVREAIRLGYRHIDCAAVYGNEAEIGQALEEIMNAGEVKREELWITSKLWNDCHREEDVRPALKKSLADLRLDYLDLYLVHWPIAFRKGVSFPHSREDFFTLDEVPLGETWRGLEACVDERLSRHIGTSNFSAAKLRSLLECSRIRPAVSQVEMHPLLAQEKLKKFCQDRRILLTAFSPLGSRDRNPAFKARNEPDMLENAVVREIASSRNLSPAQVLLAWAVNRGTSVIPKSVNPDHLKSNLEAADITLEAGELDQLNNLDRHYRYVNGAFFAGRKSPYTVGGIWDE